MIETAAWDSDCFGWRAGKIPHPRMIPTASELAGFDHVLVRLPSSESGLLKEYQGLGFAFVTMDYVIEKSSGSEPAGSDFPVLRIEKSCPTFVVQDFQVEGSRFSLDPAVRQRMPDR